VIAFPKSFDIVLLITRSGGKYVLECMKLKSNVQYVG
jgi:hypothetical protein